MRQGETSVARRGGLMLTAFAIGGLAFASQASHAVSLTEAVGKALRTNPVVQREEARREAAAKDLRGARAGYFPTVDADARFGRERSNIKQLRSAGADARSLSRREFGITVRQLVFDGLATPSEVGRRAALLAAATGDVSDTRESTAFRAVQAFTDVLRNRRLVALARANVDNHLKVQAKVRKRVESGINRRADLTQARGRVALARSTLAAREGRLREAVTRYRRVIGVAPGELTDPEAAPALFTRNGIADPDRMREAIATESALANNVHPALKAARARVTAAKASIRGARSGYFPRLDIEAGFRRDDDVAGVAGVRNTDAVMLVSRWNLFRGGADRAREQAAAARREAARSDAADRRRAIEEAVANAVQDKATSEERLGYLRAHVTASEATLAAYKAQLDLGRRTLLDTLNAEAELFQARSNLVSGLYDDLLNSYFLDASKGMLIKSLGLGSD